MPIRRLKKDLLNFCKALGDRHVTEFSYRYSHKNRARVFASVELTNGKQELDSISASLKKQGYLVTNLTDDAIAKDHVRYMVGGHPTLELDEKLFLFEFPNSKEALIRFLNALGNMFSITLFHFRISGLEFCSVLCGFNVAQDQSKNLDDFIKKVNYPAVEVTGNTAYQQFLR